MYEQQPVGTGTGIEGGGFPLSRNQTIAAVLAVVVATFIAQNSHSTKLRFLFFSWTMPVWIAFTLTVLVGIAIGYLGRNMYVSRKTKSTS